MILLFVFFLAFLNSSFSAAQPKSPGAAGAYMSMRDISPEAIDALLKEASESGIQFVIPHAKSTSGTAFYESDIIPEARPGASKALGLVVEIAHKYGLKVYPWICVNSDGGEQSFSSTLEVHPDWCVVNINGKRAGYIDPSCKEARAYVCSIVREIVSKYDIDGINLDYVRYPSGKNCFCERCIRLFKEATGYDARDANNAPPGTDKWRKWRAWRMKQINLEMEEIRRTVDEVKPGLPISSYVWGVHTYGAGYQICQDWKTWIRRGFLDWINPSGYVYNIEDFRKRVLDNRKQIPPDFPYLVTIGVRTSHGRLNSAGEVKKQVREAIALGATGVVFFTLEYTRPYLKELSPLLKQLSQSRDGS